MTHLRLVVSLAGSLALVALALPAGADTSTIKRPGAHPNYFFEAEPHLAIGSFSPPSSHGNQGFGPGFRGTIELVDNGFVSSINNTVGVGFGVDWLFYGDHCKGRFEDDCDGADAMLLPVVMQWNFWLSRDWSVFGEPGFLFVFEKDNGDGREFHVNPFVFYAGGRYHFSDAISLTLRAGWPTFSVGASFFL
jgi:hypothetical protein